MRFVRPVISAHLFNMKKVLMEECNGFSEATKADTNSIYWGSAWNLTIPLENLENGSFIIFDIQDENNGNNNTVIWSVYTINLNEIDSSAERAPLSTSIMSNKNQKTQTLLNFLASSSPTGNVFLYFDVLIHKKNKDVGTLQDVISG